jgi:hypothetical protein
MCIGIPNQVNQIRTHIILILVHLCVPMPLQINKRRNNKYSCFLIYEC